MRPRQTYKVIPGVTIKIDGEYCSTKCFYCEDNIGGCSLFASSDEEVTYLYTDGKKYIRCLRCKRYTAAQDEA